jgi:signal transduction histidine kinase
MTTPARDAPTATKPAGAQTPRAMRVSLHVITAVLLLVGAFRAVAEGAPTVAVVVMSVVFAGFYAAGAVISVRADSPRNPVAAVWWLVGIAAVWVELLVVSGEFVWLAFSLWLLAGFLLRGWVAAVFAVAVFVAVVLAPLLHGRSLTAADVIGPLVGGLFAFGLARGYVALTREARERERLVSSLVAAQAETAQLHDELAAAQREAGAIGERTRLSRDIHDTIAQELTSILLLARSGGSPDELDRSLGRIEALAQESLADVRRIVAELAPAQLDEQALPGALRRLLARLADETGIAALLQVDEDFPVLPTPVEVALLRTAQSALANVRRHSSATRVVVSLSAWGQGVRMDVVDDGVGFDVGSLSESSPSGGYGLRAMTERLRELGGGLDVESAPGDGTALSAHVPLRVEGDA